MRYFEVTEPYYSLIKATNEEKAIEVYGQSDVDEEDFEMNEVDKDYAWSKFSDSSVERDRDYTTEELLEDFEAEEEELLLIDSSMI